MSEIDSLYHLGADSLYNEAICNRLDSICEILVAINKHNQSFSEWPIETIIAALAAFYGLYQLILYLRDRNVEKKCQRKILLDLLRHLFTNNTHAEAIRINIKNEKENRQNEVLTEGVLERFCFIDYDLELNNIRFTSNSYERLHSIREKMRNYNSVCMIAEKHFAIPNCPENVLIEDLDSIWNRSVELSNDILQYSRAAQLNISSNDVCDFIREYYSDSNRIPKWIKDKKLKIDASLPSRLIEGRIYYDYFFQLSDIMDACIRSRIEKVKFKERIK